MGRGYKWIYFRFEISGVTQGQMLEPQLSIICIYSLEEETKYMVGKCDDGIKVDRKVSYEEEVKRLQTVN